MRERPSKMTQKINRRPEGDPDRYEPKIIMQEFIRCKDKSPDSEYGFIYWLANYCKILNNDEKCWVQFEPWQSERAIQNGYHDQITTARIMMEHDRVIVLKARQIGLTTLCLAFFLYEVLFHPISQVLLLSRGELEAKELLERIKKMYAHLPKWMRVNEILSDSKTEWRLSNESMVLSLSSRRGDSYSATHVLIDEAALLYRANISLAQVLLNLGPTIGQKGKMFLISKVDKSRTKATFNRMYRAALKDETEWKGIFVPYYVVPGRDEAWYEMQKSSAMEVEGTLDYVHESYPATPEEALLPKAANKRIRPEWMKDVYEPMDPLSEDGLMVWSDSELNYVEDYIEGLKIWANPDDNYEYIVTCDPGEGLEDGDNASISVLCVENSEEVVTYAGKVESAVLGGIAEKLSILYNDAPILYELNKHGHALGLWLRDNTQRRLLKGWAVSHSRRKEGWEQTVKSKALMYDLCARAIRDGECIIHDHDTYRELLSIEASTLRAPRKEHDDRATTFALGIAGIRLCLDYKFDVSVLKVN